MHNDRPFSCWAIGGDGSKILSGIDVAMNTRAITVFHAMKCPDISLVIGYLRSGLARW